MEPVWPRRTDLTYRRCSIVIPAKNEHHSITVVLARIAEDVSTPFDCFVVVDDDQDPTVGVVQDFSQQDSRFTILLNDSGSGPAAAIRAGIRASQAPVVVVTMADGSDDPRVIDDLVRLIERGVVIAAGSRYMAGGQLVGAPRIKSLLSRIAGLSLYWLARVGTRDATNNFKAYDRTFLNDVGVESPHGFEIGIELVAKARRWRMPVAELPTIWIERSSGSSQFKVWGWIPQYLHWYFQAFGKAKRPATSETL